MLVNQSPLLLQLMRTLIGIRMQVKRRLHKGQLHIELTLTMQLKQTSRHALVLYQLLL